MGPLERERLAPELIRYGFTMTSCEFYATFISVLRERGGDLL